MKPDFLTSPHTYTRTQRTMNQPCQFETKVPVVQWVIYAVALVGTFVALYLAVAK